MWHHLGTYPIIAWLCLDVLFCWNLVTEVKTVIITTWLCPPEGTEIQWKALETQSGLLYCSCDFPMRLYSQGHVIFLSPISSMFSPPLNDIPNTWSYNGNYCKIKRLLHEEVINFLCANVPKNPKNSFLFLHLWILAVAEERRCA